jgi:hypothetical protein
MVSARTWSTIPFKAPAAPAGDGAFGKLLPQVWNRSAMDWRVRAMTHAARERTAIEISLGGAVPYSYRGGLIIETGQPEGLAGPGQWTDRGP